jgi:hypothetical protein
MITITVSFKPDGSSAEVIAQVTRLLAGLETQGSAVAPVATVEATEPVKVKASRPKRVLTEAERQAIRDRFAAGKAKAALARGELVAVPDLTRPVDQAKQPKVFEVKPTADHKSGLRPAPKPVAVKSAPKPMPIKGRKVQAKPSAQ